MSLGVDLFGGLTWNGKHDKILIKSDVEFAQRLNSLIDIVRIFKILWRLLILINQGAEMINWKVWIETRNEISFFDLRLDGLANREII